jgi:hypothetical protein
MDTGTATAPGSQTSEYKVTRFALILSTIATVVGYASSILDMLPPTLKWVGPATALVGLLSTLLTALGYQAARSGVKKAALAASTNSNVVTSLADAAANLGK